jgi:glycosyltransferase involved in cell wall biosynthesis
MKVHLWAPSFTNFGGGIGDCARELARGLRLTGHETTLLGRTDRLKDWQSLPLHGAGHWPGCLQNAAFAARALWLARKERPDLIISAHLHYGPLATQARKALGIPYALFAHGIDVHPEMSASRRSALLSADGVFAVSQWTKGLVQALGPMAGNKLQVLPNTYDEDTYRCGPVDATVAGKYNIAEHEKVILMVSRLNAQEGYKGQERMMRILPALQQADRPVRLVIAGAGDDLPRLQALAKQNAARELITFTGFVSEVELVSLYRRADVFALPSTGEGFGIVFLEAMACGTPVLAGNVDGSSEALSHGDLGLLVDPHDDDAIAAGTISLLDRQGPALWFNREALSAEVRARFGRKRYAERLEALISNVVRDFSPHSTAR